MGLRAVPPQSALLPPHTRAGALGVLLLLLGATAAAGLSWSSIGPDGVQIVDFTISPRDGATLYCIVGGDWIYRSTDRGDRWERVRGTGADLSGAREIVVLPDANATLVAALDNSNKIVMSTDAGENWIGSTAGAGWFDPTSLVADPLVEGRAFLSVRQGPDPGIFRTTDGGVSWEHAGPAITGIIWDVACHPTEPGVLLATTNADGIFRSSDAGDSWTLVHDVGEGQKIAWSESRPDRVYVGTQRSDDGGRTFSATPSTCGDCYRDLVAVDPTEPDHLYFVDVEVIFTGFEIIENPALFESHDAGESWTVLLEETPSPLDLAVDAENPARVYYLSGSWNASSHNPTSLLRSEDGGGSWQPAVGDLRGLPIRGLATNDNGLVLARTEHGRFRAVDPSGAWSLLFESLEEGFGTIEANRLSGAIFESGGYVALDLFIPWILRSTDQGSTWTDLSYSPAIGALEEYSLLVTNHGTGHALYAWDHLQNRLLRSFSAGEEFEFVRTYDQPAAALIHPSDPLTLLTLTTDGFVERSSDGGETFARLSLDLPGGPGHALFLDPASPEELVAVYENGEVWRSFDGGLAWKRWLLVSGGPVIDVDWDPVRDHLMTVTENGGFRSSLLGAVNGGLPDAPLTSVRYWSSFDTILVGTASASVFALDVSFLGTGRGTTAVPEIRLSSGPRVAPNPFSRETTLTFHLPAAGPVHIAVHDVGGRLVRTLVNEELREGEHTLFWNGHDAAGRRVAGGTYFIRLQAGSETRTGRVVSLGE
jgi:photosystem II stability/assembly factor-like uncharacterized protein